MCVHRVKCTHTHAPTHTDTCIERQLVLEKGCLYPDIQEKATEEVLGVIVVNPLSIHTTQTP